MSRFHREEFKILEHKTFLNWASMSPAPLSAVKRVREIADAAYEFESGNISGEWSERSSELRSETAKLINAGREEIAVAGSSTTQGIQLAFECVSPSPGDNVVSLNTEFPDLASSFSVMAVPKIVINGDISFEGAMPEQTFLDYVLKSIE